MLHKITNSIIIRTQFTSLNQNGIRELRESIQDKAIVLWLFDSNAARSELFVCTYNESYIDKAPLPW